MSNLVTYCIEHSIREPDDEDTDCAMCVMEAENAKLREEVFMRKAEARDDRRTIRRLEELLMEVSDDRTII